MPKILAQKQINKIYKAHEEEMSTHKAAEYAGVSQPTILRYWNKEGLEAHFEAPPILTQEQINKIYKAHEEEMSTHKAAEYAGVSQPTILRYWNKEGLEAHFRK